MLGFGRLQVTDGASRNPDHGGTGWHVMQYDRIGTDHRAVSNMDVPQDLRPRTDVDTFAQDWCVVGPIQCAVSDRYALSQNAIVADHGGTMDNDGALMFDNDASPETHAVRQFDPVDIPATTKEDAIQ